MYTELGRFLNDDIHPLAPGNPLDESYSQPRFRISCNVLTDTKIQFLFADKAHGRRIFSAIAVENGQRVAGPETQHAPDVPGLLTAE